jgi:hypothetical protein
LYEQTPMERSFARAMLRQLRQPAPTRRPSRTFTTTPRARSEGATCRPILKMTCTGRSVHSITVFDSFAKRVGARAFNWDLNFSDFEGLWLRQACNESIHTPQTHVYLSSSAAPQNCSDPAKCGEVGWASHASEIPFFFGTTAGASFLGGLEHQVCSTSRIASPPIGPHFPNHAWHTCSQSTGVVILMLTGMAICSQRPTN